MVTFRFVSVSFEPPLLDEADKTSEDRYASKTERARCPKPNGVTL
jgi:hypothetical protein